MEFLELAEQFMPSFKGLGVKKSSARHRVGRVRPACRKYRPPVPVAHRGKQRHKTGMYIKPVTASSSMMARPPRPLHTTRQFIDRALTFIDGSLNDTDHMAILKSAFNEIAGPLEHPSSSNLIPKTCHSDSSAFTNQHGESKYPDMDVSLETHRLMQLQRQSSNIRRRSNMAKTPVDVKLQNTHCRLSAPHLQMKDKKPKGQMAVVPLESKKTQVHHKKPPLRLSSVEDLTSNLATSIKTLKDMNRKYNRIGGSIMSALKSIRTELKELKKKTDKISKEKRPRKKLKQPSKKEESRTPSKSKNIPTRQTKSKTKKLDKKSNSKCAQSEPQIPRKPKKEIKAKPILKVREEEGGDALRNNPSKSNLKKEGEVEKSNPSKKTLSFSSRGGGERVVHKRAIIKPNKEQERESSVEESDEGISPTRCTLENLKKAIKEKETKRKKEERQILKALKQHSSETLYSKEDIENFEYGCIMAPP